MTGSDTLFSTLVGKRIAGRYVVERLLGVGGMGLVAQAKYPELGQRVAIKFLRPELATDAVVTARFIREARVAAKVKSAHFVRVFDVGRLASGVPYYVMEMLSGRDLGDELAERGQLPVEVAVDYILQASVGLGELHALGVVHRDLKPSNLFLERAAGTPVLKVLDFGISKEQHAPADAKPLTTTDHMLGTPQYMSPEQIRASKDVDPRTDIWSLGVILFELLTRSLPFLSESGAIGEMFGKILYMAPEPPRAKRQDLPEALEVLILKCLGREREQRFANVVELAEALRPFTPEASLHRIDSVKQAAATPPPSVEDDDLLPEASLSDAAIAVAPPSGDASHDGLIHAPTALASSSDLGSDGQLPAQAPPSSKDEPRPVTAMTSSSVLVSPRRANGPRVLFVAVVVALALAAGVGIVAMARRAPDAPGMVGATTASPTTSADAPASSEPPAPTYVTTSMAATAPASASPATTDGMTAPSATTSPAKRSAPRVHAPNVRPTAKPSATGTASAAPKLILDRK